MRRCPNRLGQVRRDPVNSAFRSRSRDHAARAELPEGPGNQPGLRSTASPSSVMRDAGQHRCQRAPLWLVCAQRRRLAGNTRSNSARLAVGTTLRPERSAGAAIALHPAVLSSCSLSRHRLSTHARTCWLISWPAMLRVGRRLVPPIVRLDVSKRVPTRNIISPLSWINAIEAHCETPRPGTSHSCAHDQRLTVAVDMPVD
jgi:hypothetical protein